MLPQVFGTSWKATKRIVWVAAIFLFAVISVVALVTWRTVDSVQADDESPLRMAFAPDTLELFLNDDKADHIARAELSSLQGELSATRNDYTGAHAHYSDAVNELSDYIGLDVGLTRMVLLRAGMIEQQFKKYELAEKYLLASIKHPIPKSLPKKTPIYVWSRIADGCEERDLWADAIRIRRFAVGLASKLNSPTKLHVVRSLVALGATCGNHTEYADALKYIDEAIALNEKEAHSSEKVKCKAVAYAWRGYINLANDSPQKAVDDLNTALALNEENDWAFFYRGRAQQLLGRYDLALLDYNKAVSINPSSALEHYRRGQTLVALGKHTEAIADFSQAQKFAGIHEYVYDFDCEHKSRSNLMSSSAKAARTSEEAIKSQ